MKIMIMSLALLVVSIQGFGQRKSKEDPKDAQINSLTLKLDSVSKELVKYVAVYDTLKMKVIHYNFDPARTSYLIDSLRLRPIDSTYIKMSANYADTILVLKNVIKSLNATISTANSDFEKNKTLMTQEEIDRAKTISSLKQLKEMFDAKILTEAEFIALKKKYLDKM